MKNPIFVFFAVLSLLQATAQQNVIVPAAPFLTVAADARAASMGDMGVGTSADVYSQQWNPAKYAFATDKQGVGLGYTPYLASLVNDISLAELAYYYKIDDRSAFATSLRYFGLGNISLRQTGDPDEQVRTINPNEFGLDGSYSLKLNPKFSMAIAGRFIYSNLKIPSDVGDASSSTSFAIDLAGFYQSEEIPFVLFDGKWRAGINFQNMGSKLSYSNSKDNGNFLPTTLRLGGGFDFIFDTYNTLTINMEMSKYMIPTPQNPDLNNDGTVTDVERSQNNYNYSAIGWTSGIFKSFTDAPGGFSEEMKEIAYSIGSEYTFHDSFALRLGYFHENPNKGSRRFFSLGTGFSYKSISANFSYLFSTSNVRSPLENTLRLSLAFGIGDKETKI